MSRHMHVYIYIYMYIFMNEHTHTHTHIHTYIFTYMYIYTPPSPPRYRHDLWLCSEAERAEFPVADAASHLQAVEESIYISIYTYRVNPPFIVPPC